MNLYNALIGAGMGFMVAVAGTAFVGVAFLFIKFDGFVKERYGPAVANFCSISGIFILIGFIIGLFSGV